ncbi:MAG: ATPase [Ruminococcaceae bacterium]|nr:ATPase [Oscillospiraceae bacterium]
MKSSVVEYIKSGKIYLGIEVGSTRIKASLIDTFGTPIANGGFSWENRFENGYWTYPLEEVRRGLRECYRSLSENVREIYGVPLTSIGAIGISGMMHGYLAFDAEDNLLVPFRTWRNTTCAAASRELTELFNIHIPQRWSVAHLYQAILNGEEHVSRVSLVTTVAGYLHFLLTGRREVGLGEASGMFPVKDGAFDPEMIERFNKRAAEKGVALDIGRIFPTVRCAGETGAYLTEEGAHFLDPTGNLRAGIPLCPPEGDAGTGMVATNSVLPRTGNVSAGTSIFSMLVLEKPLSRVYEEIDIVTTPDGAPVAMVHCNNCCSELDTYVKLFLEFSSLMGTEADRSEVYRRLYEHAMTGEADCGGVTAYNYLSGEHIVGVEKGVPMCFRTSDSRMTLANFMRAQLYTSMATLKSGMDILFEREQVNAKVFLAHGGLFKVKGVAQQILADALHTPVAVMKTAGEGGAWGMALLASYMINGKDATLGEWLGDSVFGSMKAECISPDEEGMRGFNEYFKRFEKGLEGVRRLEEIIC